MRGLRTTSLTRVTLAAMLAEMAATVLLHFPRFLTHVGASELDIGTVYGTAAGVAIVLRPWMGRVIDQQGRRRVVMGAGLMSIVALLTFMTIDSFGPAVIGITILNTAAQILVFTSLYTFAADIVPLSHRTQGLMLFAMSFLVPIGLGSVLGDAILAVADFDVLFLAAILFLLASMTIVATLAEPSIDRLLPRRSFFATLRQKDLRPLWLLSFAFGLGVTSLFVWMRTFVDTTALGSLGLFFGVFAATGILVSLSASSLPGVRGEKHVLAAALASYVAGFFILAFTQSTIDLVVAAAFLGAGHALILPIVTSLIVSRSRASERGSALAIFAAFVNLAAMFSSPIIGAIIEASGYRAAFSSIGVVVALAVIGFYRSERAQSGHDPRPIE